MFFFEKNPYLNAIEVLLSIFTILCFLLVLVLNYEKAKTSIIRERVELQTKSAGLPRSRKNCLNSLCKKNKEFLVESRFDGLPMTFIYGIFIHLCLTWMILPNVDTDELKETDVKKKQETTFCFSKEILDLLPNDTSPQKITNAKCDLLKK